MPIMQQVMSLQQPHLSTVKLPVSNADFLIKYFSPEALYLDHFLKKVTKGKVPYYLQSVVMDPLNCFGWWMPPPLCVEALRHSVQ